MELKDLVNEINTEKGNNKQDKWNFSKIFDNNLFDCQSLFPDKTSFLQAKKSGTEFTVLRRKLRKKIDNYNTDFLKAKNKTDKLKILQKIKMFTDNFGGFDRLSEQTVKSFAELKN